MKISAMLRRIADWIDPPDMEKLRERIEAAQMRVFWKRCKQGAKQALRGTGCDCKKEEA